jgi:hypothetical protein
MSETQKEPSQQPPAATLPGLPATGQSIYFNGFTLGLSNADINALLLLDGQPVARLNMSFTTAKTLIELLGELMNKLELVTEQKIMTTQQVGSGLQTLASKGNRP